MSDESGDEGTNSGPYKKRKVAARLGPEENKRQAFKEMILKSKAFKYERQETKEKAEAETEKLDKELQDIITFLPQNTR